eukprot:g10124.t1
MPRARALPTPSPPQPWPRGPHNELQRAAYRGLTDRTVALLESGRFDVNQGNPEGVTPLMHAAREGYSRIVRILLEGGADTSIQDDDGYSALHASSSEGHVDVVRILVEAGAPLEAKSLLGSTPLHRAAENGHANVIKVLSEAGGDVNSRRLTTYTTEKSWGETPLHLAANGGYLDVVTELLHANANPLLGVTDPSTGVGDVPLDRAAFAGHPDVVRELMRHGGLDGCGGESGGVQALGMAACSEHTDIMRILTHAGVVDTSMALARAAAHGRTASVAFLLMHHSLKAPGGSARYVNAGRVPDQEKKPLFCSIRGCSPKVVRLLIDAGADTTSSLQMPGLDLRGWEEVIRSTPLDFAEQYISEKAANDKQLTEEELRGLEAVRRVLMQVDAIHAVSWLWHAPPSVLGRGTESLGRSKTTPPVAGTPIVVMLPLMRRRAARRGMALQALFRFSKKS